MADDARKRQKKLERRANKRKEKRHLLARRQNFGLAERLTAAVKHPILHCRIGDSLWTEGIGQVLISRELPGGTVAVASFLVDRHCLGVKDVFAAVLGRSEYLDKFVNAVPAELRSRDVPPADARKLLHEAVAYARSLGLAPHPDYPKALTLFGSIDPADGTAEFEFGQDGQPLFVAGPHDTPARCRQVLAILTNTCGPGRFHCLIPMARDVQFLDGAPALPFADPGEEFLDDEDDPDEFKD
jgi:hypothetical protein